MTDRPARIARAKRLRDKGLLLREIAAVMGEPLSTVHELLSDPDLAKHRARRLRYGGACEVCGAATTATHGRAQAAKRCREHAQEARVSEIHATFLKRLDTAVALRLEGLRNSEIEERLHWPPNAVAQVFSRARKQGIDVPRSPYFARHEQHTPSTTPVQEATP